MLQQSTGCADQYVELINAFFLHVNILSTTNEKASTKIMVFSNILQHIKYLTSQFPCRRYDYAANAIFRSPSLSIQLLQHLSFIIHHKQLTKSIRVNYTDTPIFHEIAQNPCIFFFYLITNSLNCLKIEKHYTDTTCILN